MINVDLCRRVNKMKHLKENLILMAKGFVIGIANIIPGVSGGTLAITLGIYERLIKAISHFFTNLKENIKFLVPIAVGAVLSLLILSNVIGYALDHYPIPTTLLFVGLIFGGVPLLYRHVKTEKKSGSNLLIFFITFAIVTIFAFLKEGNFSVDLSNLNLFGYILLFIVGMVAAATMVIPGISGSFMLMLLGYYQPIINTIRNLTRFDDLTKSFMILIPFGIGVLVGIVLIAKLIEFLLEKYEVKTYFGILGFVLASVLTLIYGLFGNSFDIVQILIGVVTFFIGSIVAYKLGDE